MLNMLVYGYKLPKEDEEMKAQLKLIMSFGFGTIFIYLTAGRVVLNCKKLWKYFEDYCINELRLNEQFGSEA